MNRLHLESIALDSNSISSSLQGAIARSPSHRDYVSLLDPEPWMADALSEITIVR